MLRPRVSFRHGRGRVRPARPWPHRRPVSPRYSRASTLTARRAACLRGFLGPAARPAYGDGAFGSIHPSRMNPEEGSHSASPQGIVGCMSLYILPLDDSERVESERGRRSESSARSRRCRILRASLVGACPGGRPSRRLASQERAENHPSVQRRRTGHVIARADPRRFPVPDISAPASSDLAAVAAPTRP